MLSHTRATSRETRYADCYSGSNASLPTLDLVGTSAALRRLDWLDLHYADHRAATKASAARRLSASAILGNGGSSLAQTRSSQLEPAEGHVEGGPASAPESSGNLRQRISRYAPAPDFFAAWLALLGFWLPSRTATVADVASGASWAVSGGMSELGNTQPFRWQTSATNALNIGAGMFSTAAPLTSGTAQASLDYTASALWGVSGATTIGRAAFNRSDNYRSRALAAASGVANVAAATLAAAATEASENNDSASASWYGTASSALWIAGSTLSLLADRASRERLSTTQTEMDEQLP